MKMNLYNQQNSKVGTIDLPDKIFKVKWNPDLVHQVLTAEMANRRKPLASTKDRSEVSGGGRKPWQQKGLGRARHGSIRSPLWVGGGVTHGPRPEKIYRKKVNKKMKRAALYSLLSKKIADGEVKVIDDLTMPDHKTRNLVQLIKKFFKEEVSLLVVPARENKNILKAIRNVPKAKAIEPKSLNVYDCLVYKYIFFEKAAIEQLL